MLCGKSVLMTDHRCSLSLEEEAYNSVHGLEWQLDKDSVSQPWLHVRMTEATEHAGTTVLCRVPQQPRGAVVRV